MSNHRIWNNRITGYAEVAVTELTAHPQNWRIHSAAQEHSLEQVLDIVGVVQNIVVNQRTNHVLDGHLRVSLAMRRNQATVPVTYVSVTEEEERIILATFDPLSALATVNQGLLDSILATIPPLDSTLQSLLQSTQQSVSAVLDTTSVTLPSTPLQYADQAEPQRADKSKNLLGDALNKTYKDASLPLPRHDDEEMPATTPYELPKRTVGYQPRDGEVWVIDHAHRLVVKNSLLNERDERHWVDTEFRPFLPPKKPALVLGVLQQVMQETMIDPIGYWNIAQCGSNGKVWFQIALRSDKAGVFIAICDEQHIFTELL